MARKKVNLAWITNDSARRATFKKRKKGLLKKVSELSTLCGVQACAIVYGPYEPNPEVWPSLPEAHDVMSCFQSMPEMEKSKKMMNQEGFLKLRIVKVKEQCKKLQKENCLNQMQLLMNQSLRVKGLQDVASEYLGYFSWVVEEKMRRVHDMMEYLKAIVAAAPQVIHATNERVSGLSMQMPMSQMQLPIPPMQIQRPMQMQIQMPIQMQMQMGVGSGNGIEVEKTIGHPDMLEAMQRYPWLMDMISHYHGDGGYFAGDDMGMPYGENVATWPNTFFPR